MLSITTHVKRKKPKIAPIVEAAPVRDTKKARKEWLATASYKELEGALSLPTRGVGYVYILHPVHGPINRQLVTVQLETLRRQTLTEDKLQKLQKEDEQKRLEREERSLYALNISSRAARLVRLETNHARLTKELSTNQDIRSKLERIEEEIRKLTK
jgi:hypothetical protein